MQSSSKTPDTLASLDETDSTNTTIVYCPGWNFDLAIFGQIHTLSVSETSRLTYKKN